MHWWLEVEGQHVYWLWTFIKLFFSLSTSLPFNHGVCIHMKSLNMFCLILDQLDIWNFIKRYKHFV